MTDCTLQVTDTICRQPSRRRQNRDKSNERRGLGLWGDSVRGFLSGYLLNVYPEYQAGIVLFSTVRSPSPLSPLWLILLLTLNPRR